MLKEIVIREDVMSSIDGMIDNYRNVSCVEFLIYPVTDKSNHSKDAYSLGIVINYENGREKTSRQNLIQIPRNVADWLVLPGKDSENIPKKDLEFIRQKIAYSILAFIGLKISDELKAVGFNVDQGELFFRKHESWKALIRFKDISIRAYIPSTLCCQIVLAYNFAGLGKDSD